MKTMVLRLITFFAVALFALGVTAQDEVFNADYNIGPAGGANSCATCYINGYGMGGNMVMYCGSPQSGGWGVQYCEIDSYPEGTYCIPYGDQCCVD